MKKTRLKIFLILIIFTCFNKYAVAQSPLRNIRYGLHDSFGRVVFEFNGRVDYQVVDQEIEQKIYIKFFNSVSGSYRDGYTDIIDDQIVSSIYLKVLSFDNFIVRIKTASAYRYRISTLENPWRIVLDVFSNKVQPVAMKKKIDYYSHGLTLLKNKQNEEAIVAFNRSLKDDPNFSLAYFQLGQIYEEKGQLQDALRNFKKVKDDSPVWDNAKSCISRINEKLSAKEDKTTPLINTDEREEFAQARVDSLKETLLANRDSLMKKQNLFPKPADNNVKQNNKVKAKLPFIRILVFAFVINSAVFMLVLTLVRKRKKDKAKLKKKKKVVSNKPNVNNVRVVPEFETVLNKNLGKMKEIMDNEREKIKTSQDMRGSSSALQKKVASYQNAEPNREKLNHENPVRIVEWSEVDRSVHQLADKVESLLRNNYDIRTIAKELNLGQDEIKMIISLNHGPTEKGVPRKSGSANRFEFA